MKATTPFPTAYRTATMAIKLTLAERLEALVLFNETGLHGRYINTLSNFYRGL